MKIKLTIFPLVLAIYQLFYISPLTVSAQEESSDVSTILDSLQQQQESSRRQQKQTLGERAKFSWSELQIDLPGDTILATSQGEPLVDVDEFHMRLTSVYGYSLFQARYKALCKIIDDMLVAAVAGKEGFRNYSRVIDKITKAEAEIKAARMAGDLMGKISDAQARQYYIRNIEKFKRADRGTRVLFSVTNEYKKAQEILEQIMKEDSIEKYSFTAKPLPGSRLPEAVQEAIFHLEPGDVTNDVVVTPIGFYVARLMERNAFDNFQVSVIVKNNLQECRQILKEIEAGKKFEDLVVEKEQLSIMLEDLPQEIRGVVPDMELEEVSQAIETPLGYFLVQLKERWSSAPIITAGLIRVNAKVEGEKILSRLKDGLDLGDVEEREIAGKNLPHELLHVARRLKTGQYSTPVKTTLGYYLVKVQQRARQLYKPFNEVKEDVVKMIKAEKISRPPALKYYNSHLSDYRKSWPEYVLDIILAESPQQGNAILADWKKASDEKKKAALFSRYQKDLKSVSDALLPLACQHSATRLKPGQLSPVIATPVGHFILRLNKKVDPAYLPFENVKLNIASILLDRAGRENEREAEVYLRRKEEEALAQAHYKANVFQNLGSVSDEEAEEWWQENKNGFLKAFGIPDSKIKENNFQLGGSPEITRKFKKINMLSSRYRSKKRNLYAHNNVVIHKDLLR